MPTAQIETHTNKNGSVHALEKLARHEDNDVEKQQVWFIVCRVVNLKLLGLDARARQLDDEMGQALNGRKGDAPQALAALYEREKQLSRRRRLQLEMIDRALALVGRIMTRDLFLADVWEQIEMNKVSMQRALASC